MKNEESIVSITLRIHSKFLSPDEISQILQVTSSRSHINGEKMSPRNPFSAVYEGNLWLLEYGRKEKFSDLFTEVGEFFNKHQDSLLKIAEKCSLDLFCGYFPKKSQDSFFIEYESLRKIVAVPVDIVFDVYNSSFENN